MIPNPYSGIFIVLEGIDGCGKTAQLNHALGWMRRLDALRHHQILKAKEPNKEGDFGKKIYADLADKSPGALHKKDPHGFQAWYACDSKENLRQNIIPALRIGSIILCDRFRPSMVYGAQTEKEIPVLMARNREIIGEEFIWPDLILVFDLAINTAIGRLKKKNCNLDEHEKAEVLHRVRVNYLEFARIYPNCQVVGGEQPEEAVFENVKKMITAVLESKNKPI